MRTALTIAGSDSSGGAGAQADLKTFAAHRVYGLSAITAVTAQNTMTVASWASIAAEMVVAQIETVVGDLPVHATKVGMLANAEVAAAVATAIERHRLSPLVVDPVMIATSGARLLDDAAIEVLRSRILRLSTLVTPNAPEAAVLTGLPVTTLSQQRAAALGLVQLGAAAALVTGGHIEGPVIDVLAVGGRLIEFSADRIDTVHTHGTGCTLSAAIAARLALGDDLVAAVEAAKAYVTRAIAEAPGLGHGRGPLQHFPASLY